MVTQEEQLGSVIPDEIENTQLFESIIELKQMKAKAKSSFTKIRCRLLVLIQEKEITTEGIKEMCDRLDDSEQEVTEIMTQLLEKYKEEKDGKNLYKLSQEIKQIEIEYTCAQNRAQEVLDSRLLELNKKSAYQPVEHGSLRVIVKLLEWSSSQPRH